MKILSHTLIKKAELVGIQELVKRQKSEIADATKFVKEIEQGNLDAELISENRDQDVLASSLTSMRDQMKQFSKEEKQRNWVTQGLAQFVEILRSKNENLAELTDNIIRNLVKYMGANQGALYILNDDNAKDIYLEMSACYAYDRKKHLNQRIELGQGITGQVILEKSTLYMTDIPKDFMRITSGLGEALPRNLAIVPLKINQTVFGVIEVASFESIPPYQIEFVEKLGESIASTISSVKVNERTKQLLSESQQQAEEMRAQEEEMRQNMEELAATQEDMHRVLKEVQDKEGYLNEVLNASSDTIFTIDSEYKLISWNKTFSSDIEGMGFEVVKGFDILSLFSYDKEKAAEQRSNYTKALTGERFAVTESLMLAGKKVHFSSNYSPLRKESGEVFAAAIFGRDITALTNALEESQQKAEEVKAQEEELRQNMEELSATQDEMHRVLREVQGNEAYINEILNASKDSIFTVDTDCKLISWNKAFSVGLEGMGFSVEKGFSILNVFGYDKKVEEQQRGYYLRALKGDNFEVTEALNIGGSLTHFATNYSPLRKEDGVVFAAAVYGRDVTVLTNAVENAKQLATEAQQQAEEVKAQEEELRQNMEELSTTQEEIERVLREVQSSEEYLNEVLNASKDSVFTIDEHFKLISWNKAFTVGIEAMGISIMKGMEILAIYSFDPSKVESQRSYYSRVLGGETFEISETFTINGVDQHYSSTYTPLSRKTGEVFAAAIYARDMTLLTNAMNESKRLAIEAQQQTEEVKAQEEELRQNMEELSATQDEMQRVMTEVQAKEQYMTDMINSTKDTIISVDKNYQVVNFNEAMSASYSGMGIKIEKGFDLSKIFTEQEWPKFKRHYDRALVGESFEVTEEYHSHGFDSYFVINYSPLRNEKNEVIAAAVFAKDTTQTIKAQKEAENLQRYYNDVIEGMSDCVVTIDKDYTIVVANTAFKQVFSKYGLSVEPGASLLAMAKGDKKAEEQFKKPYVKAFAGEHVEEPVRHHFDRDFQVSYNPLRDAKGEIMGVSLIAHDITQRVQLLKESQQQTEEVKAQEEELRQNMEEMQSIQEDVSRKAEEIEKVRLAEKQRADSQIDAQKKIMETTVEKFKKMEAEYKTRIQKLESELSKSKKGAVA